MSILNLSPDSFNKNSIILNKSTLLKRVENDINAGASILDFGAASSKPGSKEISADKEWKILYPALKIVRKEFPEAWISIDTFRASIARRAALEGCDLINDISAGMRDEHMFNEVAHAKIPYVLMHMRGNSITMGSENKYENMIIEILKFFNLRIHAAKAAGIVDLILDPGFGFSKVHLQNFELLAGMKNLQIFGYPLLAGVSRKSMISNLLETSTEGALNGTTAVNMLVLGQGASILRVHDVKEAIEAIKIHETFENYSTSI